MADIERDDDTTIEQDEFIDDVEQQEPDEQDGAGKVASEDDEGDSQDGEIVITIAGETPPQDEDEQHAPKWAKELRKSYRQLQKEHHALKKQVAAPSAPEQITLPPKPKLDDDGVDFDPDVFAEKLEEWHEKKRKHEEQQTRVAEQQKKQQQEWQATLENYGKAKAQLRASDYEEAELSVQETFSEIQQGVILEAAENPALVVYALGKNPRKAKEVASIANPIKQAAAIAKLEATLKVSQRKAPQPERVVSNAGSAVGSVDKKLDSLRAEAEKTGDYSKVFQYRQQQRKR